MTKQALIEGTSLDRHPEAFRDELRKASDIVVRLHEGMGQVRLTPAKSQMEIAALFDEPLPQEPQPIDAILHEVENKIYANSTLYCAPRFFGYINAGGNQAAIIAELLASAVNQICAKWHFSPAASEVERRVIRWIAQFIGYPAETGGCLLSGGSMSNFVGLAVACRRKAGFDAASLGMRGGPALTVYESCEGHASMEKSMGLLGMGRSQLRKIPILHDFTVDLEALEAQILKDQRDGFQPLCVVGNAGTTNTGAVDPLDALANLSQKHGLWFHVDAAYGGPAALTEVAGSIFRGLNRADSVTVNPHKWLYVPVEAACILVREPKALRDTFSIVADYFKEENDEQGDGPLDFKDYGPQLSRNFRALKVWMTFKAYGARKLRAAIESNIEIMRYLADQIDESKDFVRLAPVPLSVVCFQYRTMDAAVHSDQKYLDELNNRLSEELERDGRVFLSTTKIHGRRVLRVCCVNHRTRREDADFLLEVIRNVARSLIGKRDTLDVINV